VRGILEVPGSPASPAEPDEGTLIVGGGGSLDEAVDFLLDGVGPASAALREAGPEARPKVAQAVREALTPYATAGRRASPGRRLDRHGPSLTTDVGARGVLRRARAYMVEPR